ncbi:MAG: DUF4173 domain-containing protein [Acidimicrobiales bacterium]
MTDLAMWTAGPGLGWTLGATGAAVAVAIGTRPRTRASWALLAAVPVLAVWATLRTSPWLLAPDLIAVNLCLVLAATLAVRGRWFDRSLLRYVFVAFELVESAVVGPIWASAALRRTRAHGASAEGGESPKRDWTGTVLGIVLAVPIMIVLIVLLASADAVFASFFDVTEQLAPAGRHLLFLGGGALALAALLRQGASTVEPDLGDAPRVRATVGNIVLGGLVVVFGLYAASRLLALTGMAERIATTKGLTWAEYARSGFFQLLAVATIALVVLLGVIGWSAEGSSRQSRDRRVLGLVTVALVIGIVVDAIARLRGYEAAYGLTMLRLYSLAFAAWIGVVFVAVGGAYVTGYRGRRWLAPTLATMVLVGILSMNVIDPEAVVARRNLTQPTKVEETDRGYLAESLTDDALPVIAEHLDEMTDDERAGVLRSLCDTDRPGGWLSYNRSRHAATAAAEQWC